MRTHHLSRWWTERRAAKLKFGTKENWLNQRWIRNVGMGPVTWGSVAHYERIYKEVKQQLRALEKNDETTTR